MRLQELGKDAGHRAENCGGAQFVFESRVLGASV